MKMRIRLAVMFIALPGMLCAQIQPKPATEATKRANAAMAPGSRGDIAASLHEAITSGHPDRLKQATAEFGSHIAQYMNGKSADQQLDFVTSRGKRHFCVPPRGKGRDPADDDDV